MPVHDPSQVVRDDRATDQAAGCMYVLLSSTQTQAANLSNATQMALDLFTAASIRTEPLAPNLIATYPPTLNAAVHTFHLLTNLLNGFSAAGSTTPLKALTLLLTPRQSALIAQPDRLTAALEPLLQSRPQSAFLISEEIYRTAKDAPGLTFTSLSAQLNGEAFYELSTPTRIASPIPPRPIPLASASSLTSLPEHLLLLAQKQPRAWTLGLAGTIAAIFVFAIILLIPHRHEAPKAATTTPPVTPAPQPEKPAPPSPQSVPVATLPPQLAAVPPAKPKSDGKDKPKDKEQPKEKEQPTEDLAAIQPGKSHVDVFYSQQDIQTLLVKADQLTGNGKYDQAIAYYKRVLRQEPQNAEANRGIRRAMQNKAQ